MRIRFRNVRTKPQIEPEPHENSLEAPSTKHSNQNKD